MTTIRTGLLILNHSTTLSGERRTGNWTTLNVPLSPLHLPKLLSPTMSTWKEAEVEDEEKDIEAPNPTTNIRNPRNATFVKKQGI